MNHQPPGCPLTPCRCSGLLARPLARQRARRGRLARPMERSGRRGNAAAPAGTVQGDPSKPPRRTGEVGTFKWPPRKAAEQTCQPGSGMDGWRDGCSSLQPGSAHEMPAERRAGLRARPALLPRRASPGCLQVTADFSPHPSLAAFQMPKPKVSTRREKRVAGGEQSQNKPVQTARAPTPGAGCGHRRHFASRAPRGPPRAEGGSEPVLQVPFPQLPCARMGIQ